DRARGDRGHRLAVVAAGRGPDARHRPPHRDRPVHGPAADPRRRFWRRGRRADAGTSSEALLECRSVSKVFGGLTVLRDVDITLPQRGIFGLCGPNGAGKSTLLNVVGGSLAPTRGT